jgi:PAS domain S-box-containing protein
MSEAHYDRMSKKALIDRLIEAERQLRTVGAEKEPARASAARRRDGKKTVSEDRPGPASFRMEAKRSGSARPAAADIKSASESDYTILDKDGRIRRLYKVVKDIRDDAGEPIYSEGALYEINSKPLAGSGIDHPDLAGESDQTELVCRFRPNGALTYVNEAYCRYFGVEKEKLRNHNVLLSISEADREQVYSRLKDLRPERPVDTIEYRVASVFGDILWNQWTYRALFDDSGNILEYQSVGRDITFRKYTQDVLEKRAAILEAVTYAAEGFLKSSSWRDRIERVLERFGAAMSASHVFLCENRIGEGGDIAVLRSYEWLAPQMKGTRNRQKFLRNSKLAVRFSRWVYEKSEGRSIFGTIGQFPDKDVEALSFDRKLSIAVIPVLMGERWWGFMGFADYSGDFQWTEEEVAPLGTAAEILGAAIEREEKERALEETHATIRQQERFLAGVFDAIQDGIMVAAPDMTILRVNSEIEKRFPHAPNLPGRKCYEAYYGLKSPCSGCAVEKTLETGKAASTTRSITGPDGECRGWVEVFSYPWVDDKTGKIKGVIEYSRDITERKKAEEAKRQSEELLNTFLNSSQDKIFLKDDRRRYLFMNEAGLSFLGLTREEIVGKTDGDIFSPDHAVEIGKRDLFILEGNAGPLLYEQRYKDRILETTKFRVSLEGNRTGIGGIIRDITERKRAEDELANTRILLEQAFEQSPNPMALVSMPDMIVRIANTAVRDHLGILDEPSPVGQSLFEMNVKWEVCDTEGKRYRFEETALPRALMGHKTLNQEAMVVTKDGTVRHELVSGVPIRNDKGDILAGYLVCTDITERKRAEEARRQSEERLQTFLNSFRDPVFLKDNDRRYLFVNDAGLALLGRTREEIIGKADREMFDASEPVEVEKEKTDLGLLKGAGGPLLYEQQISDRIMETMKFRVNLEDGRVGIGGILRDVTEQRLAAEKIRRSEELLRTFIDSSRDYISLRDEEGRNILINQAVSEFLGRSKGDIVGKTDAELLPAAQAERSRQSDRKVLEAGRALSFYEREQGQIFEVMKFPVRFAKDRTGIGGIIRDITERVRAEQEVAEWKQRYEFVAASSGQVVYDCNFVRGQISWSGSLEQVLGYQPHEMDGGFSQWEERIDPMDLDRTLRLLDESEKKGVPFEAEYGFRHKDGHYVQMQDRGFLVPNPSGKPERLIGSMLDITERKRAEEALRQQEAMMQSILKAAPVGIAFGREREIQWSNEYYQRMTGYGENDVSGRTVRRLYDSEEEFLRVGRELYGSDRKEGAGEAQTSWKRQDGSRIDVLLSVSPLYPDDAAKGVVIAALDITEQKKADEALRASEARYRELADNMPAGIYEATIDGRVIYANRTAMEMFGFSADEVARGVPFMEVIAPESWDDLGRNFRRIRDGETFDFEYAMMRRDGSRFFGLNLARPVIRNGRVAGSSGIVTDVTELRKVQEALRNNEALLGSILQAAPIGVGMVRDRVLQWVNEGMTALTGYRGDELKGRSARMVYLDDEEFERAGREKYAEIRAEGKGAVETRWRHKDGTIIDVHLSSAPIDPANLAAGVVFSALDITAQKKASRILLYAKEDLEKQVSEQTRELDVTNMLLRIELEEHRKTEEALVNSEQLYRAIVEDQTEIICRFRPDGTISFVNEAFCRYFGRNRYDVLGSRYLPSIPREDRKKLWTAYGALAPSRPVFHMEFRIEMPDGEIRWLHWTNRAVYDESGALIEHQGVGRDITERIRSEQQIRESRNMLRSVFDGISDPLIMVREDMTLVMLNRAALRFFGALQYRDLIGAPCLEFFQGRYGQEATTLVQAVIAEQEPARYELATKGDSARYEEVFVYPVNASDDQRMAIIRITDRTKQRLLEQELIQSEKMASLGLLISGIVHEINNPNNFISFNIPILRDYLREILPVLDEYAARVPHYEVQGMSYEDFRADVLKLLENIEHGSVRINTTVGKLKEFAHKKDEKGVRPILPSRVAERAVSICHTQIRKTVKTFDVQVQPDIPEMASDPDAIEQTLINLLINAAQAADKPDSRILLNVRKGADGEGLILEVEDNGCGMDGKTVSRIFDPFFTTKEEGLGTGLGLYISKNLIEAAGGSITVESEPGRGTTFRVAMPDLKNMDNRKKPSMERGS